MAENHAFSHTPMAVAFQRIGWKKTEAQYRRYLEEQAAGRRVCRVAFANGRFAGYVTLNWQPTYPSFAEAGIPEIQDLNVPPEFRRQGIASRLLDDVEALAGERSSVVGIGVGLHPQYADDNDALASDSFGGNQIKKRRPKKHMEPTED